MDATYDASVTIMTLLTSLVLTVVARYAADQLIKLMSIKVVISAFSYVHEQAPSPSPRTMRHAPGYVKYPRSLIFKRS